VTRVEGGGDAITRGRSERASGSSSSAETNGMGCGARARKLGCQGGRLENVTDSGKVFTEDERRRQGRRNARGGWEEPRGNMMSGRGSATRIIGEDMNRDEVGEIEPSIKSGKKQGGGARGKDVWSGVCGKDRK